MKEYGAFGETESRNLTSEPYTIKVKYHDGASKLGSDIHGVMCDLAASETVELKKGEVKVIPLGVSMKLPYGDFGIVVPRSSTCLKHGIMMANSIGIIENEFCGDGDVWGFPAYAIRDAVIEQGTRIAQFMPWPLAPDWDAIMFEEVASMGCADRGGYGSTDTKASEPQCLDADGVPIEVGDVVYPLFDGELLHGTEPWHVTRIKSSEEFYVKEVTGFCNPRYFTHREPDSWEKLEEDALKGRCTYFGASGNSVTCTNCEHSLQATGRCCWENMQLDLIERAKKLAVVEEQEGGERTAIADKEER